jgi:hypothetical protein
VRHRSSSGINDRLRGEDKHPGTGDRNFFQFSEDKLLMAKVRTVGIVCHSDPSKPLATIRFSYTVPVRFPGLVAQW